MTKVAERTVQRADSAQVDRLLAELYRSRRPLVVDFVFTPKGRPLLNYRPLPPAKPGKHRAPLAVQAVVHCVALAVAGGLVAGVWKAVELIGQVATNGWALLLIGAFLGASAGGGCCLTAAAMRHRH